MSKNIILLIAMMFIMSGCAWLPLNNLEPSELLLLPPIEGPAAVLYKQKLTMTSAEGSHQMLVVTRLDKSDIKLLALMPSGQRLLSIHYNGDLLAQRHYSSFSLPSEEILATLQFALWPKSSIKKHYTVEDGWQLEFGKKYRRLKTKTTNFLTIKYPSSIDILVLNELKNYRIDIELIEEKSQ